MSDGDNMASAARGEPRFGSTWLKAAALFLVVAAVGLPLNNVGAYVVVLAAAVIIFTGEISARPLLWLASIGAVVLSIAGQDLIAPPRIEEGHNVFLPQADGVLKAGLPADVYDAMVREFDALHPPDKRCQQAECWTRRAHPDRTYAFSADGIFEEPAMSRATTGIDFSDPVWFRLGFTNDVRYNWGVIEGDQQRNRRDGRFWMGMHRWHLLMPWFVAYRLPAAYVGSELCWRGTVLWEGDSEKFERLTDAVQACRVIAPADIGRRVFGIAIRPDTLAMRLTPPWSVRLQHWLQHALALAGVLVVLTGVLRWKPRRAVLPTILLALALIVIGIDDASFLGGVRPFDGGDDGLFYDGVGRVILQRLLAGNWIDALEGGEKIFYYGGPGLRYFRALEHVVFGETYLGYLSLTLAFVFAALALFRRFLPERWAIALILVFVAAPVGTLFGSAFIDYAKWAARGFADPAAYILFVCGIVPVIGATAVGPSARFAPAFFGALLVALGIFMKPIVAPAAAVLMAGAGIAALYRRQWPRLMGLCIGFSAVLSMGLHNWFFGGQLVPFSANAGHPLVYVMPPSSYLAAAREFLTWNFTDGNVVHALNHLAHWLAGPSELVVLIPLHAAAVVVLIYVVGLGRSFDPWLRLVAGAALAQQVVALFYVAVARYHFLTWFLTMVVCAVWLHDMGVPWLQRRFPKGCARIASLPTSVRLASSLTWLQRVSA